MPIPLPDPGDLFEGKYRIERQIGSGGFAAVYRAADEATGRAVAIKILVPLEDENDHSERLVARFEREARLLAALRSSHTVTMYEFGRSADGLLYLVFEFVDGTTLRELIRLKGAQPAERVVAILRQVCTSLHEAHTLGVLHRDIKPANIMVFDHLDMRDAVKVLDFGIAKTMAAEDGGEPSLENTITTAGAILGTPRYMSPEQLAGQELTAASDIYSLGLVAFELLTGEQAIHEETVTGILRAQMSVEPFHFPRDLLAPSGLKRVIGKMASKKRLERYQDLATVLRDLEHWDDGEVTNTAWLSLVGLAVGVAVLIGALLLGDHQRLRALPVEREAPTLGEPMWSVHLESPGLSFAFLGSAKDGTLKGSESPAAIPPLAREVVAVEREGVAVEADFRWVGSVLEWDGRSLDYRFVVRRVHEAEFQAMTGAQMVAINAGRAVVSDISQSALAEAERRGNEVVITNPSRVEDPTRPPMDPPDGLRLHTEKPVQVGLAETTAMRALGRKDWQIAIDSCIDLANVSRICAKTVAAAYEGQGDVDEACRRYREMGVPRKGLCN